MTGTPAARPRASRTPPAKRGEELRAAAREIARTQGLAAITLRSVADRVGVTRTLVVHYEPSMEVLVAETFRTIASEELAEMAAAVAAEATSTAALRTLTGMLLDADRDDVTALWTEVFALGRRIPSLESAARDLMTDWQSFLVGVIERGVARGEFATDDSASVAWQYLGMIDGINSHAMVNYGAATQRGRLVCHAMEHELGLPAGTLQSAE